VPEPRSGPTLLAMIDRPDAEPETAPPATCYVLWFRSHKPRSRWKAVADVESESAGWALVNSSGDWTCIVRGRTP
jgi:hypothetical protein